MTSAPHVANHDVLGDRDEHMPAAPVVHYGDSGVRPEFVVVGSVRRVRYHAKYHGCLAHPPCRSMLVLDAALRRRLVHRRAPRVFLSRRSWRRLPDHRYAGTGSN